jgi:hypothetical protein
VPHNAYGLFVKGPIEVITSSPEKENDRTQLPMYCQLLMTDVEAGQKYLHFRQVLS